MKAINWEEISEGSGGFADIPSGGYVCKVVEVVDEEDYSNNWGDTYDRIVIRYDIAEGPEADFFARNNKPDFTHEHEFRYNPANCGDKFTWSVEQFKRFWNTVLHESNPGWTWDLNPASLKGLKFGATLRHRYYTKGDGEKALEYAKKVIEVQESHFPWIKPGRLTAATPDRVFTSEVIFGLQNLQRNNLYTSLFDGSNLKLSTLLAPRTDVAKQIFENDQVDYRYSSSLKNQVEISGTQYSVFNKYQGESSDSLCNQLIPMLRVSEAYLIAAELSTVKSERLAYLNEFRNHRGIRSQDFADDYDIKIERRKEFWGEGQLWFWYKRRQMTSIKDAISAYGETKISVDKYVLPIPDSETKYN